MKNLIYKEFKLSIHPLFYLVPLLGGLILIPSWLYFIAMSYVFFITITNIFTVSKAQNDIGFSVMLPVRKRDIVKARFFSVIAVELMQILVSIVFAIINSKIYVNDNFFLEPNIAFFGFVFIMYSIFNVIFLTMFYKTGYKIGFPAILSIFAAFIFATVIELAALLVPVLKLALDSDNSEMFIYKLVVLVIGVLIYIVSNILSYKVCAKRFEMIDL